MLIPRSPGKNLKTRLRACALTSLTLSATFAVACTAAPPAEEEPGTTEVPATSDLNGDRVVDSLGVAVDRDGDGNPDPFDLNEDGTPDGPGIDTNGDGEPDVIGVDTNGDGIYDAIDRDGDGVPDEHAVEEIPNGDGDGDVTGDGDIVGDGDISLPPPGDGDGDGDGDTPAEYCDEFELEFVPRTPTVYLLVDRSQSMFEATDFWGNLKAGVLPVVEQLAPEVRFGFGTYTGTEGTCTGLTEGAPIAENNYAAIQTAYDALGRLEGGQTPTALAVQQTTELLLADNSPGDRFILLVTDGDPDFCNNPAPQCGVDAVVAALQSAHAQGVTTLVFGIDNPTLQNPEWFNYYAQAGSGQQPNWTDGLTVSEYQGKLHSECASAWAGWVPFREANGNAPDPALCDPLPPAGEPSCFLPAGDYSAAGGEATAFLNADPAALAEQILTSVEALKSCVIDLNFEVVNAAEGKIFVGDLVNPIPQDQWRMNAPAQMELLGEACTTWQSPDVFDFFAGFPCAAIIPVVVK